MRLAVELRALHLLGAGLGGAAVGGVIGLVGGGLELSSWRPWIIAGAALPAIAVGFRRHPPKLGLQCQVPRTWARTMPPHRRYFLWGAMLGCGCATAIPHSAFVLLVGTQLTAGVLLGALSGAVFGVTRQTMAVVFPLARSDHEAVMDLLPDLGATARGLNALVALGVGLVLFLTTWK